MKTLHRWLLLGTVSAAVLIGFVGCVQRRLLYFPSHEPVAATYGQTRWMIGDEYTGYSRLTAEPRKVWFFLHGNGGQAGNRAYFLARIPRGDSAYILEYPGYGDRPGKPSRRSFDDAATKAWLWLVQRYGVERLIVAGESLGSGPACQLAKSATPPAHLVLLVPFDELTRVAKDKFPYLPVGLIMLDRWNNIESLQGYTGRLDIFGARYDQVIPVEHARALAASHPGARYHEFEGDHGWANSDAVDLSKL